MNINDSLQRRLLALAEPVLCSIPGAMEQFKCEAYAGGLSLELSMLLSRDPFAQASKHDAKLESLISGWVKDFHPVSRPTSAPKKPGDERRWTPEFTNEVATYRGSYTEAQTAEKFGVSGARIREMLAKQTRASKPKANPLPTVVHRIK